MTTTWNIHPNLSAWAAGMYAAGNRVSSSGNAYQCIKGGTATGGNAPTGSANFIATNDNLVWKYLSAIDYSSLVAWANFVTLTYVNQPDDWVVLIWNNGTITTTIGNQFIDLYGITAGVHSTLITAAAGESFVDKGNSIPLAFSTTSGVNFDAPAVGTEPDAHYFNISIDNVTISRLQFRDLNPSNDSGTSCVMFLMGGAGCQMSQCILDGCFQWYTGNNNNGFVNCLIVNRCTTSLNVQGEWPVKWDVSATGAYFMDSTCVGIGGGAGNIISGTRFGGIIVILNSTVPSGFATNSIIIGGNTTVTPDPLFSQNSTGGWAATNCATDVANFGSNASASGCIFNVTAAAAFVNATTDFRLKTGASCIDAGTPETTHDPSAVDIFNTARPRGAQWDIGAYEYGLYNVLLAASSASTVLALKTTMKTPSASEGQTAASTQTKQAQPTKSVSVGSAQSARFTRVPGKFAGAASAEVAAFAVMRAAANVSAAKSAQAFSIVRRYGKFVKGATAQTAAALKLLSKTVTGAQQANTALTVKAPGKVTGASTAEAFAMVRSITALRGAVTLQSILVLKLVGKLVKAASDEAAAVLSTGQLVKHAILSASSPEALAAVVTRIARRLSSATNTQTVQSLQGRSHVTALSAGSTYAASIVRQIAALRGAADPQAIGVIKAISRAARAASTQAAAALKTAGKALNTATSASQAMTRTPIKVIGAATAEATAAIKAVGSAVHGATTQVAAVQTFIAWARRLSAASTESASVVRQTSHIAGAASGSSQRAVKQTGYLLGVGQAKVSALIGALGRTHPLALSVAAGEAVALIKSPTKLLIAADAQVAAKITQMGHVVLAVTSETAGIKKQVSIIRPASNTNIAGFAKGFVRFFTVATPLAAAAMASRAMLLGFGQASRQAVIRWYRFYIPPATGPAVLVPPADGPPEPFAFGAMDPSDTSTFIFDWSQRATPGDPIASATITSTGLNILGPTFIQGYAVEVTCGPFSPPVVPAVYGLRCSVIFVSGRRSSYTIPVPVQVL